MKTQRNLERMRKDETDEKNDQKKVRQQNTQKRRQRPKKKKRERTIHKLKEREMAILVKRLTVL